MPDKAATKEVSNTGSEVACAGLGVPAKKEEDVNFTSINKTTMLWN